MTGVATNAQRALDYLHELSPQLHSVAILDDANRPLAGRHPAGPEPASGGVLVQAGGWGMTATAVAPAGVPLALAEHDLRLALSEVRAG